MLPSFIPWFLQNFIWIPTNIILRLFGAFKVKNLGNIDGIKGSAIFVSNHASQLDPILLPAALPMFSRFLPMFYVSREKEFYDQNNILKKIFYGGFFFKIWGAYQAYVGKRNFSFSLQNHLKIIKDGKSLFIFPEGKKSFDGKIHEFFGGAAFLSRTTGVPIVPITINGAYQSNFGKFFSFKKKISIIFGKPIYPDELFDGKEKIIPHDYKIAMNNIVLPRIAKMLKNG
ncbi:MAG: lysophospholipid acyltransferase family protein [Patescibacteria group bacterium]